MKLIHPKIKSTGCSPDGRHWVPTSFRNFLVELDHAAAACEGADPATFFRGQSNYEWPLDSSFVRFAIPRLFGLSAYQMLSKSIRQSKEFHRTISSLLLLKFGTLSKPSDEAVNTEKSHNIDPWYEFLKNLQQYPEKDSFIKGTFLIDWTGKRDIALYFATFDGRGSSREITNMHGAVWVLDAVATGKTWQTNKLGELLQLMASPEHFNAEKTFPLIYHPKNQTHQPRAVNQMPVYVAQMDYRYDLADLWAAYENKKKKRLFITIIMTENLKSDSARYLEKNGLVEELVYPE
jgi:hypothetical protein